VGKDESEKLKTAQLPGNKRPSLIVNALSNWTPLVVNIIIHLLLTPYLISQLGKKGYGIWALVGSFIGYFGLLRLGVGSGIMRYVPFYIGRNDHKAASEIINTGLSMFLLAGLVIFSVSMLLAEPIARFYKAGPELAALVRILGLAAAIECPMRIFGAGLRAQEKWVAANFADIVGGVMQALGLAGCIYLGYGLVEMGYVTLATTAFSLILMTVIFIKLSPAIHLQVSMVRLSHVPELTVFGLFTTVITLAYSLSLQSHKLIIGKLISLEAVAVYAVAAPLVDRVRRIVWAPFQVAWPRFALLDGENNHREVSSLFYKATRYSNILSSGTILLILVAGPSFIRLWVGEGFEAAYPVLTILGIGCLIETSLYANSSLLGGTGRQGTQALFAGIEGVLGLTLSILLGMKMGLAGVALGFTVSVILIRGLVATWYACRILHISILQYFAKCVLRPWLIMSLLAILTHQAGILEHIDSWSSFAILAITIGCLYTLLAFVIAMNDEEKKTMLHIMRKLFRRIRILTGVEQ